jgi:hypothetical protein
VPGAVITRPRHRRQATDDDGWQVIYIVEPELKRHTIPAQREAEAADSWAARHYWHNWLVDAWR